MEVAKRIGEKLDAIIAAECTKTRKLFSTETFNDKISLETLSKTLKHSCGADSPFGKPEAGNATDRPNVRLRDQLF